MHHDGGYCDGTTAVTVTIHNNLYRLLIHEVQMANNILEFNVWKINRNDERTTHKTFEIHLNAG